MNPGNPAERINNLLANGRFTTLATSSGTTAWAATVNYVALPDPLRLLWSSMIEARHSVNIAENPNLSGTIYMTGLQNFPLDGLQYEGTASSIEDSKEVDKLHQIFFELNFPDQKARQQWATPVDDYLTHGKRRLYIAEIHRCWLLDIDRWLADRTDARIEVRIDTLWQ